jgi:hypothetical protein
MEDNAMLGYYVDGFSIFGVGDHEGAMINLYQSQPDEDKGDVKRIQVANIRMDNECVQRLYDSLGELLNGTPDDGKVIK